MAAVITVDVGGVSTSLTLSDAHQARVLAAMKNSTFSGMVWPVDGNGETIEPTNAQVAKFVGEEMLKGLKQKVQNIERSVARQTADVGVAPVDGEPV